MSQRNLIRAIIECPDYLEREECRDKIERTLLGIHFVEDVHFVVAKLADFKVNYHKKKKRRSKYANA
jgi:hypothetical protein